MANEVKNLRGNNNLDSLNPGDVVMFRFPYCDTNKLSMKVFEGTNGGEMSFLKRNNKKSSQIRNYRIKRSDLVVLDGDILYHTDVPEIEIETYDPSSQGYQSKLEMLERVGL